MTASPQRRGPHNQASSSLSHGTMAAYPERASLQGFEIELFKLISSSATPEQWREWLRVPLKDAARRGNLDLFIKLLEAGADVNTWDLLHIAAGRGHDGIISTLLLSGVDKDALDIDGETPLILASAEGHVRVVKTLLAAGADFKIRNDFDDSALGTAAAEGHVPVIEAILSHGADVNDRDNAGFTALHAAADSDQPGVVHALVEAGADIEAKHGNDGITPLSTAAQKARCKSMLALLQHGVRLGVRDNQGNTELHRVCFWVCTGLEAAVDLLLRWGADETALNDQGLTPAEVLDDMHMFGGSRAPDEIVRTRLLLSRAPADRAWRRRGWLIMLRSRAEKARALVSCDCSGNTVDGPSVDGGSRDDGGSKATRTKETRDGGGEHVVRIRANSGVGIDGGDGDGDGDGRVFSGAVGLLVGLEVDGVFRTVLSFL